MKESMNRYRRPARLAFLAVLGLVTIFFVVKRSRATVGTISKADLSGAWQMTFFGDTGCGLSSMVANVTLGTTGTGTATIVTHGQCGDSTVTGQPFTITSLSSNGSGKAGMSCGTGCGFTFQIQVAPDRSVFNLADLTDTGNFLGGVAIHQ